MQFHTAPSQSPCNNGRIAEICYDMLFVFLVSLKNAADAIWISSAGSRTISYTDSRQVVEIAFFANQELPNRRDVKMNQEH